jgi:hypothetical protein
VVVDVVVDGSVVAVVDVVVDGSVVAVVGAWVVGTSDVGEGSPLWLSGVGTVPPPITYTGVPLGTTPGSHSAAPMLMRTQPWDAGYPGTLWEPWMAMPPLK